jgi:hypothetical protein
MKQIIRWIFFALASLICVNNAPAQRRAVRVTIPFSFSAAGNQMPAGIYTFKAVGGTTYISRDGALQSVLVNGVGVATKASEDDKLVFTVYDGQHFLKKILCPSVNLSLEFSSSKAEIRAQQQILHISGS